MGVCVAAAIYSQQDSLNDSSQQPFGAEKAAKRRSTTQQGSANA
jgi:hypothetical protein